MVPQPVGSDLGDKQNGTRATTLLQQSVLVSVMYNSRVVAIDVLHSLSQSIVGPGVGRAWDATVARAMPSYRGAGSSSQSEAPGRQKLFVLLKQLKMAELPEEFAQLKITREPPSDHRRGFSAFTGFSRARRLRFTHESVVERLRVAQAQIACAKPASICHKSSPYSPFSSPEAVRSINGQLGSSGQ
jgi:hypothetical protein